MPGESSQRDERGVHGGVGYDSDLSNPSFNLISFSIWRLGFSGWFVEVVALLYDWGHSRCLSEI